MAQTTSGALDEVQDATAARERAQGELDLADVDWRTVIRQALTMGCRVSEVASAANISRERVYQIRDGRR